jgi:hypothetical protein
METINDVKTYADFVKFANAEPILCNNIMNERYADFVECVHGEEMDGKDYKDVYQYYIVSDNFAEYIKQFTDEILYYHNELDLYVWGITHFGTSWSSVDIDIKK